MGGFRKWSPLPLLREPEPATECTSGSSLTTGHGVAGPGPVLVLDAGKEKWGNEKCLSNLEL